MKKLTIEKGLETGELVEIERKIFDVKKLEESKNPECKYSGEVVEVYKNNIPYAENSYLAYGLKIELKEKSRDSYHGLNTNYIGYIERYYYECPCGKGKILREHDHTIGYKSNDIYIDCDICREQYKFAFSKDFSWDIVVVENTNINS